MPCYIILFSNPNHTILSNKPTLAINFLSYLLGQVQLTGLIQLVSNQFSVVIIII